jgi:hypothetical protein
MPIPPRLRPLLMQFDHERNRLATRLVGLTDDEYLWEPASGCWSVRRREQTEAKHPYGGGGWVIEFERPEPDPPPFTTLAWRLCHLACGMTLRADYTTGSRAMTEADYLVPGSAEGGLASLDAACSAWRATLVAMTDADLDQVGRSQFPRGLDPQLPFLDIVWWVNQELLHHGGEIALLRDLYRAQARETMARA